MDIVISLNITWLSILHLYLNNSLTIKPSHYNTKKSIEKSPTVLCVAGKVVTFENDDLKL